MPELTFFDTAAGLIPVLLLGGAITERFRREESADPPGLWWSLLVIVLFFFLPVVAEVTAISVALGDVPDNESITLVAFAVAFGTLALAASLTWPWLEPLVRGGGVRTVIAVAMFIALVAVNTRLLIASVDLEALNQQIAAQEEQLDDLGSAGPFNVQFLRHIDAVEKDLNARLAAGRISRRAAAQERLRLARVRKITTEAMIPAGSKAEAAAELLKLP